MIKKQIIFLATIFILSFFLFSQERALKVVAKTADGEIIKLYKGCHALVIGVSDYLTGWPDLPNAARDADEIGDLLSNLGFEVTRVKDPTKAQLIQAFDSFIYGPGQDQDNCLVIFFAGHGHSERFTYGADMGYIVPKDAPLPTRDKAGFMQKAINMQTIEAYARSIQAKHALFLFDSCFSGAIFDMVRAIPADISYKTERPVRQFITAGEADEPVPDDSIFKSQLIEGLGGEADRTGDGYVTGSELGEFLQEKVVKYSRRTQHPQYGKIRDPNLDKGDFVFKLFGKPEEAEKPIEPAKAEVALEPRYGSLEISIDIPGASIYLDGTYKGTIKEGYEGYAFVLKPLLVGIHTVRISHEKYKNFETSVKIFEDKRAKLAPELEPVGLSVQEKPPGLDITSLAPQKHIIKITSSPDNARVVINGVERGKTPFYQEIQEGRYKIKIEKKGYKPREEELKIKSDLLKKYDLEKLGYGYLIISFHPFAEVEIDGKPYGEVPPPLEVKLLEGKHVIKFIYSKFRKEKTVDVELSKEEIKRVHEKSKSKSP